MQTIVIEGTLRTELGKKSAAQLRREELVPCVMYAGGKNYHFTAPGSAFRHLIFTPDFKLAEVVLEGKKHRAIVKDVQFHPVKDHVTHVDFLELVNGQSFKVEVPLRTTGLSEGVKKGGKLLQQVRKIKIQTTPEKLVDNVTVDITHLDLGKSVRVRDIKLDSGVLILNNPATPVATIEIPRALRSAQAEETTGKKK